MNDFKNEKELLEKIESFGIKNEQERNETVCKLVGHSLIQHLFMGKYTCSRCGVTTGDSLVGCYPEAEKTVVVGHKCPTCEENYKKLTWKDKVFCPNPFEQ